jgi:hypothetical protein
MIGRILRTPSIEVALLNHDVLSKDEPVRSERSKLRKNALYVFLKVDENNDYRQVAASFHESCGVNTIPACEPRDGVERASTGNILVSQRLKNLVPLVRLVQIHRHLDCGLHFSPLKAASQHSPENNAY